MKPSTLNPTKGFTLVEILVVIAVIGLLSLVVFASFEDSRKKARDTARTADMQQITAALQVFAATYGRYPSSADGSSCTHDTSFSQPNGCLYQALVVKAQLFTALPSDPLPGRQYHYDNWCNDPSGSSDKKYRLWSHGERNNNGLAQNWWADSDIGSTPCADPS